MAKNSFVAEETFKDTFFRKHTWMTASEICSVSFLRIFFFVSLDKSVLVHHRCLMWKFSENFDTGVQKNISAFFLILQETFSNSCEILV